MMNRQCNMQLLLFKSLYTMNRNVPILHLYDINCQFATRLWAWFNSLPKDLQKTPTKAGMWTHAIPKLHIMGHILKCQAAFSLNFLSGCAQTDSEGIKRMWVLMNGITLSTCEMQAGQ
jgi:hypothetical protein